MLMTWDLPFWVITLSHFFRIYFVKVSHFTFIFLISSIYNNAITSLCDLSCNLNGVLPMDLLMNQYKQTLLVLMQDPTDYNCWANSMNFQSFCLPIWFASVCGWKERAYCNFMPNSFHNAKMRNSLSLCKATSSLCNLTYLKNQINYMSCAHVFMHEIKSVIPKN